ADHQQQVARGDIPTRRKIGRRPMRRNREHQLDFADIERKTGASAHGFTILNQGKRTDARTSANVPLWPRTTRENLSQMRTSPLTEERQPRTASQPYLPITILAVLLPFGAAAAPDLSLTGGPATGGARSLTLVAEAPTFDW